MSEYAEVPVVAVAVVPSYDSLPLVEVKRDVIRDFVIEYVVDEQDRKDILKACDDASLKTLENLYDWHLYWVRESRRKDDRMTFGLRGRLGKAIAKKQQRREEHGDDAPADGEAQAPRPRGSNRCSRMDALIWTVFIAFLILICWLTTLKKPSGNQSSN